MRKGIPILVLALGLGAAAPAATLTVDDRSLSGRDRYERCLALGRHSAAQALAAAGEWQNAGGGAGAMHCAAIALASMRRYSEAAVKLDAIGRDLTFGNALERSTVLDQAGNAWLLAGKTSSAESSFSRALGLTPDDPDILTDRARARGLLKNFAGAEADLTQALRRDPKRADLLVLRASARHALGRKAEARTDIDQALTVFPKYPEALVERGVMKYESGDTAGARSDWQFVISNAPGSAAADVARQHMDDANATAPAKSGG